MHPDERVNYLDAVMSPSRDRASAVLARFPGPVTLRTSTSNSLILLGVGVALTIAGAYWIVTAGENVRGIVVGSVFVAVFGCVILVSTRGVRASDAITLAADHFQVLRGPDCGSYSWREVGNFHVVTGRNSSTAVFDRVHPDKRPHGRYAKFFGLDYDAKLPDCAGLSARDLAHVMDAWRRHAVENGPHAPDDVSADAPLAEMTRGVAQPADSALVAERSRAAAEPSTPIPRVSRRTKIALLSAAGAVVAIVVVGVVAVGGHRSSPPSPQVVLPFDLSDPTGVTVDSAGAVYVCDYKRKQVLKLPPGSNRSEVLVGEGLLAPTGVAVDGLGNVYVADFVANADFLRSAGVVMKFEVAPGEVTGRSLPIAGLVGSIGDVAVDSAGTVYVTQPLFAAVLQLPADSTTSTKLSFPGLNGGGWARVNGLAVDGANSVYVVYSPDINKSQVLKLAHGATASTQLPFAGLSHPAGVAVDTAGNVYVADSGNHRVLKLAAGSNTPTELSFTGLSDPYGVAVDTAGNVYVTDRGNHQVLKMPRQ
jgi:DNA-binding beta-propeller fold protein YncE